MPWSDYRPSFFQSTHCLETITLQSSNPGTGCKYLAHFFHLPLLYLLYMVTAWSRHIRSLSTLLTIFLVKSQIGSSRALVYRRRKNRSRRKRRRSRKQRKKRKEKRIKGRRWRRRSKRKQEETRRRKKKGSRRGKRWRGKKRRRKTRIRERGGGREEKEKPKFLKINAMHQMLYLQYVYTVL